MSRPSESAAMPATMIIERNKTMLVDGRLISDSTPPPAIAIMIQHAFRHSDRLFIIPIQSSRRHLAGSLARRRRDRIDAGWPAHQNHQATARIAAVHITPRTKPRLPGFQGSL